MQYKYKKYRMLDINWLYETFRYDEKTGLLYNKVDRFEGEEAGTVAGYINKQGYWKVMINYVDYYQHIIIWRMTHNGDLPKYKLNRKNGDKSDNRLDNLVDTNHPVRYGIYGKSKFRGVSWDKYKQKWRSSITIDGHHKFLGYFRDEIEAAKVWDNAARKIGRTEALMNFPSI